MSLLSRFFPTSSSLQVMVAVIFPHVTTAEPLLKDIFQTPAINVDTHEYANSPDEISSNIQKFLSYYVSKVCFLAF